jgi:hypothetical protein
MSRQHLQVKMRVSEYLEMMINLVGRSAKGECTGLENAKTHSREESGLPVICACLLHVENREGHQVQPSHSTKQNRMEFSFLIRKWHLIGRASCSFSFQNSVTAVQGRLLYIGFILQDT